MPTTFDVYRWNGSSYGTIAVGAFTFDPSPSSISKEVKVEWRVRHRGLKNDFKITKWRHRRTEVFKMKGIIDTEAKRLELEAIATTNAKLRVRTEMLSAVIQSTDYGSTYPGQTPEYAYFIITGLSFEAVPGKTIFQYDLTLERVSLSG